MTEPKPTTYSSRATAIRGAKRAGLHPDSLLFDEKVDENGQPNGRWSYRTTQADSTKGAVTLIWNWLYIHDSKPVTR